MESTDNRQIEHHPLQPFLPSGAKILMLGSFPPSQTRWSMNFYYPNMQNDMWRIMGLIFFDNKDYFVDDRCFDQVRIMEFCAQKGIAIGDTARSVVRLNNTASDKFLEIVEPTNIESIIAQLPMCSTIVTTGQKATDTLLAAINCLEPAVGHHSEFTLCGRHIRLYRMPSSSRAYPKPLAQKADAYREMFYQIGML